MKQLARFWKYQPVLPDVVSFPTGRPRLSLYVVNKKENSRAPSTNALPSVVENKIECYSNLHIPVTCFLLGGAPSVLIIHWQRPLARIVSFSTFAQLLLVVKALNIANVKTAIGWVFISGVNLFFFSFGG